MGALNELSIEEASSLLRSREISSAQLTEACLSRIAESDGAVGSFLKVTAELAHSQAAQADARLKAGDDVSPLTGIPIGLKDLFIT
jgi:aspartyl-tRNA(Asn)/glutamyl-tRNA(Gln) amidotransferase subunit A